ncbi:MULTISPECIES: hypothetical protein [Delftia]|uniref:hypothetical protein n=1 Tax=Delftia TaxID=80865 RepID=UPI000A571BE2|nr:MULTISPECIES: hypothetical protein [Delftia]MPT52207.1 hypothetical protein [Delftia sp.]
MNKTLPLGRAARLYQFGVSPCIGNGPRIGPPAPCAVVPYGRKALPSPCQALSPAAFKDWDLGIACGQQACGFFNCLPFPDTIGIPIESMENAMSPQIWCECTFALFALFCRLA